MALNIRKGTSPTLTVVALDNTFNPPASLDGPPSWSLDGNPISNGGTGNCTFFGIAVQGDGMSAVLYPTTVGGPGFVAVNASANSVALSAAEDVNVLPPFASSIELVLS